MDERFNTYEAFWQHYLKEHADPNTRTLHYVGTAVALIFFVRFLATGSFWSLLIAVVSGYLFAWAGHFLIEKNRPATFEHPLWSLYSDFRMFFLWLSGRLGEHLRNAGVR
jgi:hypothetical protein